MDIICLVKSIEPFEAMKVSELKQSAVDHNPSSIGWINQNYELSKRSETLHEKSLLLPKFPKKEPKHSHKTKLLASAKVCSKEPNHYT